MIGNHHCIKMFEQPDRRACTAGLPGGWAVCVCGGGGGVGLGPALQPRWCPSSCCATLNSPRHTIPHHTNPLPGLKAGAGPGCARSHPCLPGASGGSLEVRACAKRLPAGDPWLLRRAHAPVGHVGNCDAPGCPVVAPVCTVCACGPRDGHAPHQTCMHSPTLLPLRPALPICPHAHALPPSFPPTCSRSQDEDRPATAAAAEVLAGLLAVPAVYASGGETSAQPCPVLPCLASHPASNAPPALAHV